MAKFKLTQKKNPMKKDEPAKWYAIPSVVNRLTTRTVCKVVTRNTTTAPTEAESTFNLVCDGIIHELQQGNSVQLGELGWLRLSFGSEGVEDLTKFDAASMIKNLKVVFSPSKTLLSSIEQGLEFENVGVVSEGFTFPSTKSYLQYVQTGKLPTPGDDDEEEEEEGGSTEPGQGGGEGTLG